MNMALQQAYTDNVLDEKVHGRLVQDIDRIASVANIPTNMILRSMSEFCSKSEIEWVKQIRTRSDDDKLNLAYVGEDSKTPIESRMMSVAGACLRNFIDARIFTVQEVIALMAEHRMSDPSVLLIPNFFISKNQGGHISSWHISTLLGLLISRLAAKKVTVLYIDNLKMLELEYGKPFSQHIKSYYDLII